MNKKIIYIFLVTVIWLFTINSSGASIEKENPELSFFELDYDLHSKYDSQAAVGTKNSTYLAEAEKKMANEQELFEKAEAKRITAEIKLLREQEKEDSALRFGKISKDLKENNLLLINEKKILEKNIKERDLWILREKALAEKEAKEAELNLIREKALIEKILKEDELLLVREKAVVEKIEIERLKAEQKVLEAAVKKAQLEVESQEALSGNVGNKEFLKKMVDKAVLEENEKTLNEKLYLEKTLKIRELNLNLEKFEVDIKGKKEKLLASREKEIASINYLKSKIKNQLNNDKGAIVLIEEYIMAFSLAKEAEENFKKEQILVAEKAEEKIIVLKKEKLAYQLEMDGRALNLMQDKNKLYYLSKENEERLLAEKDLAFEHSKIALIKLAKAKIESDIKANYVALNLKSENVKQKLNSSLQAQLAAIEAGKTRIFAGLIISQKEIEAFKEKEKMLWAEKKSSSKLIELSGIEKNKLIISGRLITDLNSLNLIKERRKTQQLVLVNNEKLLKEQKIAKQATATAFEKQKNSLKVQIEANNNSLNLIEGRVAILKTAQKAENNFLKEKIYLEKKSQLAAVGAIKMRVLAQLKYNENSLELIESQKKTVIFVKEAKKELESEKRLNLELAKIASLESSVGKMGVELDAELENKIEEASLKNLKVKDEIKTIVVDNNYLNNGQNINLDEQFLEEKIKEEVSLALLKEKIKYEKFLTAFELTALNEKIELDKDIKEIKNVLLKQLESNKNIELSLTEEKNEAEKEVKEAQQQVFNERLNTEKLLREAELKLNDETEEKNEAEKEVKEAQQQVFNERLNTEKLLREAELKLNDEKEEKNILLREAENKIFAERQIVKELEKEVELKLVELKISAEESKKDIESLVTEKVIAERMYLKTQIELANERFLLANALFEVELNENDAKVAKERATKAEMVLAELDFRSNTIFNNKVEFLKLEGEEILLTANNEESSAKMLAVEKIKIEEEPINIVENKEIAKPEELKINVQVESKVTAGQKIKTEIAINKDKLNLAKGLEVPKESAINKQASENKKVDLAKTKKAEETVAKKEKYDNMGMPTIKAEKKAVAQAPIAKKPVRATKLGQKNKRYVDPNMPDNMKKSYNRWEAAQNIWD